MAYTKLGFTDDVTDLDMEHFNHMEDGIGQNADDIDTLKESLVVASAGSHNSNVRGKSLGSAVTADQHSAMSGGAFDDLFLGDYWTINSVQYYNAAFDYFYRCGSTINLTTHHSLIVPGARLYTAPMNATNTTEGAYVGSAMYTCEEIEVSSVKYTGLANAIDTIKAAFGDYVVEYEAYFANAITNGYPSAGAWYSGRICDLMTEHMVYGGPVMEQMSYGGTRIYNYRVEKSQLPLFALDPTQINIRAACWLRDVVSATYFADVTGAGYAHANGASTVYGVRPYFLIS